MISFLIGCFLGILSAMGVGGGSILILWLTNVIGLPFEKARSINLLFFLSAASVSCCIRFHKRTIKIGGILAPAAAATAFSAVFTILSASWDTNILRKMFGVLLLFIGVRELRYKNRPIPKNGAV